MKIAIASSSIPPGLGISVYVNELSKCLNKRGHEIMVFVTSPQDFSSETYEYPIHLFNTPIKQDNNEYDLVKYFYEAVSDFGPDAILINDCIYASNILPSLPPECMRASVVHGYRPGFGFDGHRLITSAAIHNHNYLDWLIGTSKYMCHGLTKHYGVNPEMIKLVYNGVQSADLYSNDTSSNKDNREKLIIFAGGFNQSKGYDVFFNSIKILSKSNNAGWKVVWIGGDGSPPDSFSKSGLLNKIIDWKGTLPLASLRKILANAHILAMPSRSEACPMLLIDGLSMGIVPIVSDCPSAMMEIVYDAKCGLVSKVGNSKDLAKCLIYLLSNPNIVSEMSRHGKEYFYKNLTIETTCNNLLSLLTKRRNNFKPRYKKFPSGKIYPHHRKPYRYSKWHPFGFFERVRLMYGILPTPLKYLV